MGMIRVPSERHLMPARKERMRRLLGLSAPDIVIAREAVLIARAYHGGPWRLVWWLVRDRVRWRIAYFSRATQAAIHPLGFHFAGPLTKGCWVCEMGEREEDEQ